MRYTIGVLENLGSGGLDPPGGLGLSRLIGGLSWAISPPNWVTRYKVDYDT